MRTLYRASLAFLLIDMYTKNPINNAIVLCDGKQIRYTRKRSGYYVFSDLYPKNYRIDIICDGFLDLRLDFEVRANETKTVIMNLPYAADNPSIQKEKHFEIYVNKDGTPLKNGKVRFKLKDDLNFIKLIKPAEARKNKIFFNIENNKSFTFQKYSYYINGTENEFYIYGYDIAKSYYLLDSPLEASLEPGGNLYPIWDLRTDKNGKVILPVFRQFMKGHKAKFEVFADGKCSKMKLSVPEEDDSEKLIVAETDLTDLAPPPLPKTLEKPKEENNGEEFELDDVEGEDIDLSKLPPQGQQVIDENVPASAMLPQRQTDEINSQNGGVPPEEQFNNMGMPNGGMMPPQGQFNNMAMPNGGMMAPQGQFNNMGMPNGGMMPPQGQFNNMAMPNGGMMPPQGQFNNMGMPNGGMMPPQGQFNNMAMPNGGTMPPQGQFNNVGMPNGEMMPPQGQFNNMGMPNGEMMPQGQPDEIIDQNEEMPPEGQPDEIIDQNEEMPPEGQPDEMIDQNEEMPPQGQFNNMAMPNGEMMPPQGQFNNMGMQNGEMMPPQGQFNNMGMQNGGMMPPQGQFNNMGMQNDEMMPPQGQFNNMGMPNGGMMPPQGQFNNMGMPNGEIMPPQGQFNNMGMQNGGMMPPQGQFNNMGMTNGGMMPQQGQFNNMAMPNGEMLPQQGQFNAPNNLQNTEPVEDPTNNLSTESAEAEAIEDSIHEFKKE